MLTPLYEKLKAHFGIDSPTEFLSQSAQQVRVDPRIRDLVGADGQPIMPGPPIAPFAKTISADCFIDALGTTWRKAPGTIYYEIHEHPLRHATIDDLETYQWPDFGASVAIQELARRPRRCTTKARPCCFSRAPASFRPPTKCGAWSNSSWTWRPIRSLSPRC